VYSELRCIDNSTNKQRLNIPTNVTWALSCEKPEQITRVTTLVKDGDIPSMLDITTERNNDAIKSIRSNWHGNIKVTCTVEAVD
jgi:hypothetical protein